jgi:CheY-like chemotaxis protein
MMVPSYTAGKVVPFTRPKPLVPPPAEALGATVLVVDDERAWRVILETDLLMLGYRVALAGDAPEALAQADQLRPDVAIVDLMLPEPMDGWSLIRALRAQGTPTPTIFYTAYPTSPEQAADPDVVACVSKANDKTELFELLPEAIRRRRGGK